ncbi:MAG: hypothetical protein GXO82_07540 [Chlorobi bacterium]|nr:hypothetical protein [Chlorobiota bacterium]
MKEILIHRINRVRNWYRHGRRPARFLKYFFTILILLLILVGASAEFTSRPQFCPTCHYMETFYNSWRQSAHNNVSCVKCHFEPGLAGTVRGKLEGLVQVVKYVSQAYRKSKPWAEIPDASCLQSGCHRERLLHGDVTFKGVHFNHRPHLEQMRRGKKLRCTSCHSQIVQGEHITVTESTCFLCHFKKDPTLNPIYDYKYKTEQVLFRKKERAQLKRMSNCKTCHNWKKVPESVRKEFRYDHTSVIKRDLGCYECHTNVISGEGEVPKTQCFKCHFEDERLERYDDHTLIHEKHITENKIECENCHFPIVHRVKKVDPSQPPDCNSCHPGTHEGQVKLFAGTGGEDVKSMPNPMHEAGINCRGCHIFHTENMVNHTETYKASGSSCDHCHGSGYQRLLQEWTTAAKSQMRVLDKVYRMVTSRVRARGNAEVQHLISNAKNNIELVRWGKSIHNIQYSNSLMISAYNDLKKAADLARVKLRFPKLMNLEQTIPSACVSCHTGIITISKEKYGLMFPHKKHVYEKKIPCSTCHSNRRKHGELILRREDCMNCHHKAFPSQTGIKCATCHQTQVAVFSGNVADPQEPSMKSEAGLSCEDCHLTEKGKVIRATGFTCAKCHDEGYGDVLHDWQDEVQGAMKKLRQILTSLKKKDAQKYARVIADAEKVLTTFANDRSRGAHNPDYFSSQAEKLIARMKELSGS